ncbi:MAG: ATP-binding protein [Nitrososphaerota archaeon]|nr:ATP-binding protein [Nitrososphaerota archaeon]MDG7039376.1 ATP-binding protein [Nitrososphaerota archaeon]
MNDEELLGLIASWNFWGRPPETGITRDHYVNRIEGFLRAVGVVAVTGVRRAGKSYVSVQTIKRLIDQGTDPRDTLIIRLDDERLLNPDYQMLLRIYDLYRVQVKRENEKTYVLLDEAQEVEGWERFVRGLSERREALFIVTGSSSKLLSSEFSTLLSGRFIEVNVTPLSFREYLGFGGLNYDSPLSVSANLDTIKREMMGYINGGGFPDSVLNPSVKNELILSYFNSIIVKDVVKRYGIRDISKVESLARFYVASTASTITFNSVSKFLKIPLKTVERYSGYLESAFIFFFLRSYSSSPRAVENSPRKVHIIDNGLLVNSAVSNTWRMLESAVAQELKRVSSENNISMYYWKGEGAEVDIVLEHRGKLLPVQVSYSIAEEKSRDREFRALRKFMKLFGAERGMVITMGESMDENQISVVPAHTFFLNSAGILK